MKRWAPPRDWPATRSASGLKQRHLHRHQQQRHAQLNMQPAYRRPIPRNEIARRAAPIRTKNQTPYRQHRQPKLSDNTASGSHNKISPTHHSHTCRKNNERRANEAASTASSPARCVPPVAGRPPTRHRSASPPSPRPAESDNQSDGREEKLQRTQHRPKQNGDHRHM